MSILNKLMGTAETAARGAARGRGTARPTRGMPSRRTMPRGGMARGTGMGWSRGRGRPAAPAASGIAGLVQGFLRRR